MWHIFIDLEKATTPWLVTRPYVTGYKYIVYTLIYMNAVLIENWQAIDPKLIMIPPLLGDTSN